MPELLVVARDAVGRRERERKKGGGEEGVGRLCVSVKQSAYKQNITGKILEKSISLEQLFHTLPVCAYPLYANVFKIPTTSTQDYMVHHCFM